MSISVSDLIHEEKKEQFVPEESSSSWGTITRMINYKDMLFLVASSLLALRILSNGVPYEQLLILGKDPLIAILTLILFYSFKFFLM